jgi:hypothetical protein
VKRRRLSWPIYLVILFGVTAAVDVVFDLTGFEKGSWASLIGSLLFVIFWVGLDLLTGQTPSQLQREQDR